MKHKNAVKIIARMGKKFERILRIVESYRNCGRDVRVDVGMGSDGPAWVSVEILFDGKKYRFDVNPSGKVHMPTLHNERWDSRPQWADRMMRRLHRAGRTADSAPWLYV